MFLKYFQKKIFLILIISNIGYGNFGADEYQYLVDKFDETINWINDNAIIANDGYILCTQPASYYEEIIEIQAIANDEFVNLPDEICYQGKFKFREQFEILISQDLNNIYLSESNDFENAVEVKVLEEIPGIEKWFVSRISNEEICFNYGWLYSNSWYAEALISMFLITNKQEYLDKAESLLLTISNYVDDNGKWYRYTLLDGEKKYIAMSQSILMQAIYKFISTSQNDELEELILTLSESYSPGTEGVYNHWSNSCIGEMIRDKVLHYTQTDYDKLLEKLALLYSRIEDFNGNIPYRMDENDPLYPDFRETYQTYDTYLLALMSNHSLIDIEFNQYFNMTFNESIDINYDAYFANNTLAALNILKAYGIRNDNFIQNQHNSVFISQSPTNVRNAVAKLQSISALLEYEKIHLIITENSNIKLDFKLNQNYPNPFNAGTNISYFLPTNSLIKIIIYDLSGKPVNSLVNKFKMAGQHTVYWNGINKSGQSVSSGHYIYELKSNTFINQKIMTLIK